MMLCAVVLNILLVVGFSHECGHDEMKKKYPPPRATYVQYENHPWLGQEIEEFRHIGQRLLAQKRRLQQRPGSTTWSKIRIIADFSSFNTTGINATDVAYFKRLVGAVIEYAQQFISVVPIVGPLRVRGGCGRGWFSSSGSQPYTNCVNFTGKCGEATVPMSHRMTDFLQSEATGKVISVEQGGAGIANADLIVYVTRAPCTGSTVAFASTCTSDQFDRSIAGNINICDGQLSPRNWKTDVSTIWHELGHILYMSNSLFPKYRFPNGTKRADFGKVFINDTHPRDNGLKQFYLISPAVKKWVRSHIGCNSLIGAHLEDSGGSGTVGSHFDMKQFFGEFMVGFVSTTAMLTTGLSFAAMEDSGWYQLDKAYIEPFFYGKGQGCGFLTDACINNSVAKIPEYTCTDFNDDGCSPDSKVMASCSIGLYGNSTYNPIPPVFQYFSNPRRGGSAAADYCPNRQASVDANSYDVINDQWCMTPNPQAQSSGLFSVQRVFGASSRCVSFGSISTPTSRQGYCVPMMCNKPQGSNVFDSISFTFNHSQGGSDSMTCTAAEAGALKVVPNLSNANIRCPNVSIICDSTKPFACAVGNWDAASSSCKCHAGYMGSTCDTRSNATLPGIVLSTSTQAPEPKDICVTLPSPNQGGSGTYSVWSGKMTNYLKISSIYKHTTKNYFIFYFIDRGFSRAWFLSNSVDFNLATGFQPILYACVDVNPNTVTINTCITGKGLGWWEPNGASTRLQLVADGNCTSGPGTNGTTTTGSPGVTTTASMAHWSSTLVAFGVVLFSFCA